MIRYLLDTDHVTLIERGHAILLSNLGRRIPEEIAICIVTI